MAIMYIDNKAYDVNPEKNVLENCLALGFDLPYFCWHPEMRSVGACRQCAVKQYKDENDTKGEIMMSCMIAAEDQTRISLEDEEARDFRKKIVESLMENHPHDCPTCDEGGECHLQDMTVMTGHNYRRYRFNKRTFRNQYLGPFINHEMNRCIHCYRCVRFYDDYAGGKDLQAMASKNHVYFGRHEEGTLENEFSGNLVEVCPTGVFTDKTLKQHYTRKWDLTTAPSICTQCGLGCNIIPGERYGSLRRIRTRYNGEVNGYFICDRGRYGYEYVNSQKRIRSIRKKHKGNGDFEKVRKEEGIREISEIIQNNQGKIVGIGSPRASLEANFALEQLVGKEHFVKGNDPNQQALIWRAYQILQEGNVRTPSLNQVKEADAVFILGEDVTNTAPMLALNLRQAAKNQPFKAARKQDIPEWHMAALQNFMQDDRGPFYIAASHATGLDDIATQTRRCAPEDIARLGFAVAGFLDEKAPFPDHLTDEERQLAETIATNLREAERPLVLSGFGAGASSVLEAASNVAEALQSQNTNAAISLTMPEANSLGLEMMGGESLAFDDEFYSHYNVAVILENDLYRRGDENQINAFLEHFDKVIAIDHMESRTTNQADYIIPAGTFAEADGTLVNNEGRAQRFYQVFVPEGDIFESWRWIGEISNATGFNEDFKTLKVLDDFTRALAEKHPEFKGMEDIDLPPGFRINGQKIAREPHRYSGRTAMHAHEHVIEEKPPEDVDTPMSFTMEGFHGQPPSSAIPFFWAPGWNSNQSVNKYTVETGGPLHGGDPGKRLLEPSGRNTEGYFKDIPEPFNPGGDKHQVWVKDLYHIFGSEELSVHSPGLAERIPEPYLLMAPGQGNEIEVEEGEMVTISLNEGQKELTLPVRFSEAIPSGMTGIPVGLPNMPYLKLPDGGKIQGGKND